MEDKKGKKKERKRAEGKKEERKEGGKGLLVISFHLMALQ